MLQKQNQQWLERFKLAVIELDENRIENMIDNMPSFDNLDQMQTALALMAEAKESLKKEAKSIKDNMIKIKKNKAFLDPYIEKKRLLDKSF